MKQIEYIEIDDKDLPGEAARLLSASKMEIPQNNALLLHACCGPCSLMPYKLLKEMGWQITILYSNDNTYPLHEYDKRYDTLVDWAKSNNIKVIKDNWDNQAWQSTVGKMQEAKPGTKERINRCSNCYKLRFTRLATYAKELNIPNISTTLSVSPYQYTQNICDKLQEVAKLNGLNAVFFDFTPYYRQAQKISLQAEMYRQHYCGCQFSLQEYKDQQKQIQIDKAKRKAKNQEIEAKQKVVIEKKRREKQEYAKKQAKKKQLLKEFKNK